MAIDLGFDEARLPEDVARGVVVRNSFSTLVTTGENGAEYRDQRWSEVRRSYEVTFQVWDDPRWVQLRSFFRARRGKLRGFRLTDPSEHMAGYYYAGFGQYAVGTPVLLGTGDGASKTFQCAVTEGGLVYVCKKLFERPNAPCKGYVNGAEAPATFNMNTGQMTFATAPPAGATVRAAFFYDIPARFDIDSLEATFQALTIGKTGVVPLVEIKV